MFRSNSDSSVNMERSLKAYVQDYRGQRKKLDGLETMIDGLTVSLTDDILKILKH